jgi:lipoprotein-anchoring transpeptidase ErfK/SrfK
MRALSVLSLLALVLLSANPAFAAPFDGPDWGIYGGHFFTQTGDGAGKGFSVINDDSARFESEFYRLGGEGHLGYPISERYEKDGLLHQAFQKAVLRWRPETASVEVVSVFNDASAAKYDQALLANYKIPLPLDWTADAKRQWPEVVAAHQAILDSDPVLKGFYFSLSDPVELLGLPMSNVLDTGPVVLLRLEKGFLQRWKQDQPFANAGNVTVGLTGVLAAQMGMVPKEAGTPIAPEQARGGERWLEVALNEQDLNAYEGMKLVYTTKVSTGVPGLETPKGEWKIFYRVANETMDSATIGRPGEYRLANVLFTQYFAPGGVALHYNYWTPEWQFGQRAGSHGCVGMRYDDALFMWEFANVGTRVLVHD